LFFSKLYLKIFLRNRALKWCITQRRVQHFNKLLNHLTAAPCVSRDLQYFVLLYLKRQLFFCKFYIKMFVATIAIKWCMPRERVEHFNVLFNQKTIPEEPNREFYKVFSIVFLPYKSHLKFDKRPSKKFLEFWTLIWYRFRRRECKFTCSYLPSKFMYHCIFCFKIFLCVLNSFVPSFLLFVENELIVFV